MMRMKIAIPVFLLLVVLLLSGCASPASQTPEQKAIALADQTVEGKIIASMNQSFGKIQNCTVDEFVAVLNAAYIAEGGAQLPDLNAEQKAQIAEELEKAKSCAPSVEKDVSAIEGSKYKVAYAFSFPSGCEGSSAVFMEVDVDIEAGSAEVVKGAIPEAQRAQTIAQMQSMLLAGDCGAVMLFMSLGAAQE